MRDRSSQGFALALLLLALACDRPEPLTAQKAEEVLRRYMVSGIPIYAEVPQRVWWSAKAPKDDFDDKSLRTLDNLQKAGLVTVKPWQSGDRTGFEAAVTQKGFPVLGTAPSLRGPCFRAKICEKKYDGIRNFQRHPSDPTIGHAELIWHYEKATWLYPLFETKINKPIGKEFASLVAFYWKNHEWHFDVTVNKTDV
jgi:hypothetical protein